MNILLIGNGFDLAHELPTKYTDFLEFIKVIKQILHKEKVSGIDWGNTCQEVRNLLNYNKGNVQTNLLQKKQMWQDLINENIWIDYFLQNNMHGKENWIDFESEISDIIQSLDYDMHGKDNDFGLYDEMTKALSNEFLDCHEQLSEFGIFKEIRDRLYTDLNNLICALEIYLAEYVNAIDCAKESPDIIETMMELKKDKDGVTKSVIMNKVICFNYTNTFERVYPNSRLNVMDYIHGKAEKDRNNENNNMVLGIDEFLPEERQNMHTEFIAFKKFYQRIYKQTGCKYKEWVDEIREDYLSYLQKQKKEINGYADGIQSRFNRLAEQAIRREKCKQHNLYIFGHSLDVTDRDILRDLILNDNVYTTIFYHNKDAMGQQIANLVKVIGQDELIRRTGGSTKTIEFKQQQDMIPIKSNK